MQKKKGQGPDFKASSCDCVIKIDHLTSAQPCPKEWKQAQMSPLVINKSSASQLSSLLGRPPLSWNDQWRCGYPHVKVSIRDLSQISATSPIFQQYNYFRQNSEENVTFTFYLFSFASHFPCKNTKPGGGSREDWQITTFFTWFFLNLSLEQWICQILVEELNAHQNSSSKYLKNISKNAKVTSGKYLYISNVKFTMRASERIFSVHDKWSIYGVIFMVLRRPNALSVSQSNTTSLLEHLVTVKTLRSCVSSYMW